MAFCYRFEEGPNKNVPIVSNMHARREDAPPGKNLYYGVTKHASDRSLCCRVTVKCHSHLLLGTKIKTSKTHSQNQGYRSQSREVAHLRCRIFTRQPRRQCRRRSPPFASSTLLFWCNTSLPRIFLIQFSSGVRSLHLQVLRGMTSYHCP